MTAVWRLLSDTMLNVGLASVGELRLGMLER